MHAWFLSRELLHFQQTISKYVWKHSVVVVEKRERSRKLAALETTFPNSCASMGVSRESKDEPCGHEIAFRKAKKGKANKHMILCHTSKWFT